MARRKRTTTSVSTLVSQIHSLRIVATAAGRKDLLKVLNGFARSAAKLSEDYTLLRQAVDPFVKTMLTNVTLADMEEDEAEEEIEA